MLTNADERGSENPLNLADVVREQPIIGRGESYVQFVPPQI